jgi:RimJ/RimL family protein N-acetyltransferase
MYDRLLHHYYGDKYTNKLRDQALFVNSFPIHTPRLVIREIEPQDFDTIHAIASKPGFYYYYFDGSKETSQQFVNEAVESQNDLKRGQLRKSFMMLAACRSTGKPVGHVTLDILDKAPDDYDLAYFVDPGSQGQRYATEIADAMVSQAFNALSIDRVVATVHPANLASRKVLKKLGFIETDIQTEVESADGDNNRKWLYLTRDRHLKLNCNQ